VGSAAKKMPWIHGPIVPALFPAVMALRVLDYSLVVSNYFLRKKQPTSRKKRRM
jgi:hypothetical protein